MSKMFDLLYYVPGLTDTGLEQMDKVDRNWMWEELRKRKDAENKANKKAAAITGG